MADDTNRRYYSAEYPLLERGRGGVSAQCLDRGLRGKWTVGYVSIPDNRLRPYLGNLVEGGIVIDKVEVDTATLIDLAVNGPMVDIRLRSGEVDRCPQPSGILLAGLTGSFLGLAAKRATDPTWSGLDSVDLATYTRIWYGGGARIGQRRGNSVYWVRKGSHEVLIDNIPSTDNRWKGGEDIPDRYQTLTRITANGLFDQFIQSCEMNR